MKIALAQLNSINNIDTNFQVIKNIILDCSSLAADAKPRLIVFPENSLFYRIEENEKIQPLSLDDGVFSQLEQLSKKSGIAVLLTTAILDQGNVWNATVIIDQKTTEIVYRKIHLFDIALADQKPIRESDIFSQGSHPAVIKLDGISIGLSICYDIRFSELYSYYAKNSVDVILIPAAFLVKTGQAHWETLLRARAIESQCYILAPAQSGRHKSYSSEQFRDSYGHTMAVDPWGEIIGTLPSGVGLLNLNLDLEKIKSVRRQIPMSAHRRL